MATEKVLLISVKYLRLCLPILQAEHAIFIFHFFEQKVLLDRLVMKNLELQVTLFHSCLLTCMYIQQSGNLLFSCLLIWYLYRIYNYLYSFTLFYKQLVYEQLALGCQIAKGPFKNDVSAKMQILDPLPPMSLLVTFFITRFFFQEKFL